MPHGAPDYWGISVRPSFGGARSDMYFDNVAASAWTILHTIVGNGIIYGGNIIVAGAATQQTDVIAMSVDGTNLGQSIILQLNDWKFTGLYDSVVHEIFFDNVNFVYVIGLMPGITFESSIEILYQETYGRTPVVRSQIIYTEI